MKITKEKIKEIEDLKSSGKNMLQISKQLGISYSTIKYHLNKKYKDKAIKRASKNQLNKKINRDMDNYREYQRNYHRERCRKLKTIKKGDI